MICCWHSCEVRILKHRVPWLHYSVLTILKSSRKTKVPVSFIQREYWENSKRSQIKIFAVSLTNKKKLFCFKFFFKQVFVLWYYCKCNWYKRKLYDIKVWWLCREGCCFPCYCLQRYLAIHPVKVLAWKCHSENDMICKYDTNKYNCKYDCKSVYKKKTLERTFPKNCEVSQDEIIHMWIQSLACIK